MTTNLYGNARYLLYDYRRGYDIIKTARMLMNSQWMPRDELVSYQNGKLKKLMHYVHDKVPFYRGVMKNAGLLPGDIRSVEDLRHFPVLTKSIIRDNFAGLMSSDINKQRVVQGSTGGSTGEPLRFLRDINTIVWAESALLRGKSYAGYKIGDTVVNFMTDGNPSFLGKMRERIINNYSLPAFDVESSVLKCMTKVRALKPFCMISYASNLYRIAQICNKNNVDDIHVPVIFSTGEMLYDYQREFLERQFRSKVFDYYGCNEIGSLAYECEHHARHLTDEHVIVESTDSTGTSVENALGEITVTDLDNYAMPFIRYKNGDLGIISDEKCKCRRGLRVLKSLEGRAQDFLKTPDGGLIPAIFFPSKFRDLKGLDQYQIIQSDMNTLIIKIVRNDLFSRNEMDNMVKIVVDIMGGSVHIEVEECAQIPLTGRGKNRLVISHIPTRI